MKKLLFALACLLSLTADAQRADSSAGQGVDIYITVGALYSNPVAGGQSTGGNGILFQRTNYKPGWGMFGGIGIRARRTGLSPDLSTRLLSYDVPISVNGQAQTFNPATGQTIFQGYESSAIYRARYIQLRPGLSGRMMERRGFTAALGMGLGINIATDEGQNNFASIAAELAAGYRGFMLTIGYDAGIGRMIAGAAARASVVNMGLTIYPLQFR